MLLKHIVMYLFYLFYDVNSGFIKKISVESFSAVNYFMQILFQYFVTFLLHTLLYKIAQIFLLSLLRFPVNLFQKYSFQLKACAVNICSVLCIILYSLFYILFYKEYVPPPHPGSCVMSCGSLSRLMQPGLVYNGPALGALMERVSMAGLFQPNGPHSIL